MAGLGSNSSMISTCFTDLSAGYVGPTLVNARKPDTECITSCRVALFVAADCAGAAMHIMLMTPITNHHVAVIFFIYSTY